MLNTSEGNSSITDWTFIETESRSYAERKKNEGRFKTWTETTPTYDLMAQHEIVARVGQL